MIDNTEADFAKNVLLAAKPDEMKHLPICYSV